MKNLILSSKKSALALVVSAALTWTGVLSTSASPHVPDPPAGCSMGATEASRTRTELKEAMRAMLVTQTTPVKNPVPGDPVASTNCASVSSCGTRLGCFKVFGGGSQYIYGNRIPACIKQDKDCFDVRCRVRTFDTTRDCSGEADSDGTVDRRGCRKQNTAVGADPR